MSSLSNAHAFQLWAIGLWIATMLVVLSLGAICAYLWNRRPEKVDPLRQRKLERRLSKLAETTTLHAGN
jgi:hypothetical protein